MRTNWLHWKGLGPWLDRTNRAPRMNEMFFLAKQPPHGFPLDWELYIRGKESRDSGARVSITGRNVNRRTVLTIHRRSLPSELSHHQSDKLKQDMRHAILSLLLASLLCELSPVLARSLCVRSNSDASPYQVSGHGARMGRLIGRVSTEVTSQFMLELLTANLGHSEVTCGQGELDTVLGDYERCVKQVQHSVRCTERQEEVCGWVSAFTDTCTGQILGRCLTDESVTSLKMLQKTTVKNNAKKDLRNCENSEVIQRVFNFATDLQHTDNFLSSNLQKYPSSAILRLG